MALEQVAKLTVLFESLLTDLNAFTNPQSNLYMPSILSFANGTGANQMDRRWESPARSLGSTAAETLDLNAGALLDYRGNVVTFARVKVIYIKAAAANPNNINVGDAASPFATMFLGTNPRLVIRPGGGVVLWAPDATGYLVT